MAYATRAKPAQAARFEPATARGMAGFNLGQIRAKFPLSAGRRKGRIWRGGGVTFGFCRLITEFDRMMRFLRPYYGVLPKGSAFHALLRSLTEPFGKIVVTLLRRSELSADWMRGRGGSRRRMIVASLSVMDGLTSMVASRGGHSEG